MEATTRLLDLQALDLAIDRLTSRRRALEEGQILRGARADADAAERELGELRLSLDTFDRDGAKLEHEIDSLDQKASAERKRMSDGSVANARELEAMGREIENLDRRKSDREDELLALLEQREAVEARATESEARLQELRTTTETVASSSAEELGSIAAEIESKTAERAGVAQEIDPEVRELYDDLRAHKKGVGAAALVDGVCQGCHERVSSVELDHLLHSQGLKRCEHCRRILIV